MTISLDEIDEKTSLKSALGPKYFRHVHNLVKMALFSKYEGRRAYARKRLLEETEGQLPMEVDTVEDKGEIYAYLRFTPKAPWLFVEKYGKNRSIFELEPDEEERKKWPKD